MLVLHQAAALLVILAGAACTTAQSEDYSLNYLDLLRALPEKFWLGVGPHHWTPAPPVDPELGNAYSKALYPRVNRASNQQDVGPGSYEDDNFMGSEKRSAVATALNSGRRRRQPTSAIGKAVTPYVGVGVLNDVGFFFDSLRDNLNTLASLTPQQRSDLFQDTPTVVHAPSSGGSGGSGIQKMHALRPLKPTTSIRSYNRRSVLDARGSYPQANRHDPEYLWSGLGRR